MDSTIISRNPATGETLKELPATARESLGEIFTQARTAQQIWAAFSLRRRARVLIQIREALLNHLDEMTELIAQENGKPPFEALANELIPAIDTLTYFAKNGPRLLRDRKIPLSLMRHYSSTLQYWPLGTVAIISPWNYPFLLPIAQIVTAILAGNAVIFKPSEAAPQIGLKIQELCEEAGLPLGLLQTVIGDGTLGAAIIEHGPDKIFFTGSVPTGKKVMTAASAQMIPVNLELGGKDAMIVMADADLDHATSAALWGSFSNSGQTCASIERVVVHESVAAAFTEKLKQKIELLRAGEDLGVITVEQQKAVYEAHLADAYAHGATFVTGGVFNMEHTRLVPTVVTGEEVEVLALYKDESFGPLLALTTFKSVAEAVKKVNSSRYGLTASIMTRNHSLAREVARQLEVGTVMINEVTYTAGLAETPWGGVKESGIGRTHGDIGLYEFVHVKHVHGPRSRLFVFKSPWWFPYTTYQYEVFRNFANTYRRHWIDKLKAFPLVLWNLVQMIKNEKRL